MLLGGRYELLTAIASGGMATVHLARAVGVGGFERLVAVKVMHPHIASEPEFVTMFLDEARLAARIRHPNVVATIDVQEDDGLFLVMEFVDGPSLKRLRQREVDDWRLPLGVVVRVIIDTLLGLHAAHELCGDEGEPLVLVHRDVSPANILVGVDGVSRITDFGVARAETRLSSTRGGQLKGKVPYMPPEQLMGQPVDRRADVYAAGVVLWEELVGRRLFKADSEGALLQRIITGPDMSPRQAEPSVPAPLDYVCMVALQNEPERRYPSAAAMAEALEGAAAESGVTVATSRAVAAFVEGSGAHEQLDPRKLALLKRASSSGVQAPHARAAASSLGSWPSGTGGGSRPSGSAPSLPSEPSALSTGAATLSASPAQLVQRSGASSRLAIGIGAAIAVCGLVGGFLLARSSAAPVAVEPPGAESPALAAPPASAETPAAPSDAASAAPAPSVSASVKPTSPAPPAPVSKVEPLPKSVVPHSRPTQVPKPSPPPPPRGSYDPDKL